MPPIGPTELIILLVVVLIVFGVGKLPEVGGALGKGIKEFKKAQSDVKSEINEVKADLQQTVSLEPTTEADKSKTA